ncbi:MAG: hypothetical protein GF309_03980 [Candidatus Lokiarchaeota archaeon]|nr:hypothetical protein [Candidatus Lokiarchaeota archaeon]
MSSCTICGRELSERSDLCEYHWMAKKNIERGYERWKQALDIPYEEYLQELRENEETGRWIKDVVDAILAGDVVSAPS